MFCNWRTTPQLSGRYFQSKVSYIPLRRTEWIGLRLSKQWRCLLGLVLRNSPREVNLIELCSVPKQSGKEEETLYRLSARRTTGTECPLNVLPKSNNADHLDRVCRQKRISVQPHDIHYRDHRPEHSQCCAHQEPRRRCWLAVGEQQHNFVQCRTHAEHNEGCQDSSKAADN